MKAVMGSVFQRKDGRWAAIYLIEGKKRCAYGKTKNEAINKRDEDINNIKQVLAPDLQIYSKENEPFLRKEQKKQAELDFDIKTQTDSKHEVVFVAINKLTPFNGHPFRLYESERLDDMVESIKTNGILIPIIVRRKETTLEILSGHNRMNAAKLAGVEEVPAIILENLSDENALAYVVETNLIQRSFSDMAHSEKAAVIALHHSKMFSQGKRNDILEQLKTLDNPHENKENRTLLQSAMKLTSKEKIGEMYNLSKDTVARYIRVSKLIPALKSLLDKGGIPFIAAVTLSFLNEEEQALVNESIEQNKFTVDIKKVGKLRESSEKGKLNNENIYKILSGETKSKTNRTPTIKFKKDVYEKYFRPTQSTKEVHAIIEKALELYFKSNK